MPGNYLNIDINFPTFTGKESEKEQTEKMLNYLRQLVDELKYTLNNLEEKNFNKAGLDKIMEDGTEDIREQVEILTAQLQQTNSNVAGLSTRVGNLEGLPARMTAAEGEIHDMSQDISTNTGNISTLQGSVSTLQTAVNVDTDTGNLVISATGDITVGAGGDFTAGAGGGITVGATGTQVDINGNVYINGTPQ